MIPTQTWEGTMVRDPSVYQFEQYNMWYWNDNASIGYATSPDGVNWTKYSGNPVFKNVLTSVFFNNGTYGRNQQQSDMQPHRMGLIGLSMPTTRSCRD